MTESTGPAVLVGRAVLYEALSLAQARCAAVAKDARNRDRNYKYTSAETIIAEGKAALSEFGLSLFPKGGKVEGPFPMPLGTSDFNQGKGGEVTRKVREGYHWTLKSAFRLAHKSGQSLVILREWPVVLEPSKTLDKAVASAATMTLAYLLRDLLLMPRVDESENMDAGSGDKAPEMPSQGAVSLTEALGAPADLFDVKSAPAQAPQGNTVDVADALAAWANKNTPSPRVSEEPAKAVETPAPAVGAVPAVQAPVSSGLTVVGSAPTAGAETATPSPAASSSSAPAERAFPWADKQGVEAVLSVMGAGPTGAVVPHDLEAELKPLAKAIAAEDLQKNTASASLAEAADETLAFRTGSGEPEASSSAAQPHAVGVLPAQAPVERDDTGVVPSTAGPDEGGGGCNAPDDLAREAPALSSEGDRRPSACVAPPMPSNVTVDDVLARIGYEDGSEELAQAALSKRDDESLEQLSTEILTRAAIVFGKEAVDKAFKDVGGIKTDGTRRPKKKPLIGRQFRGFILLLPAKFKKPEPRVDSALVSEALNTLPAGEGW